MTDKETYNFLGNRIIAAAFEVRKNTGPGLREKYYEKALVFELKQNGLEVKEQVAVPSIYKGIKIDDSFQADIIVENKIILEIKAMSCMMERETRQLITYLKLTGMKLGYLINFGALDFSIGNNFETYPYYNGIYRYVNNL